MPLLLAHQSPTMGIWKITEPWQDMLELFENKAVYAEEIRQIQSDKRKQEWLAVRLLLKHLVGTELTVGYRENGTPFLINSPYHVSISHTKGYAAVILNRDAYPGIDIEYRSERAWKLRQRFMDEKELNMLASLNDNSLPANDRLSRQITLADRLSRQITLATVCWCAKETAFKALRETEVDFINHLHITPFALSEKGSFLLTETKTPDPKTFLIHYQVTEDYVLTMINEKNEAFVQINS